MATTYRFKTIMVEDSDRTGFSVFRDRLAKASGKRITDKELFTSMWDAMDKNAVRELVLSRVNASIEAAESKKLAKLQEKIEAKLEKLRAKVAVESVEVAA